MSRRAEHPPASHRGTKEIILKVLLCASVSLWLGFVFPATAAAQFGFGQPATEKEIAGWNIDVRPDGQGLPKGSGSVKQGQVIYDATCAVCHGTFGESNEYLAIAGGVGTLKSPQPVRTVGSKLNYATTLWDYINRSMPFTNPQTLTADEVYAVTAYVLNLNEILPDDAVLDEGNLAKLKMPNREGFTTDHGFMRRDGKPDVVNTACMKDCEPVVKITSALPDYARNAHGELSEQMRSFSPIRGVRTGESAPVAKAQAPAAQWGAEVAKNSCFSCHGVERKIIGPGFKEVATKYAGDGGASARLAGKVKMGGAGVWGQVAMPPQTQLSDAELNAVVAWILDGAK